MKSFKVMFNFFACYCLVFSSTFAQASFNMNKVRLINKTASLDNMEQSLKGMFTTIEDHRKISYEFVKLKKFTRKWSWRYEVKGESMAFRVNGKIQAYFKDDLNDSSIVYVNGVKIHLRKGLSFQSFYNQLEKAVNKKMASWNSLFINEAEAFLLFPLLLAGGIGFLIGKEFCKDGHGKNHRTGDDRDTPVSGNVTPSGGEPTAPTTGPRRRCSQRGRRYTRVGGLTGEQAWVVAQNFKIGGNCEYVQAGRTRVRPRCFENVQHCVQWKMGDSYRLVRGLQPNRTRSLRDRTFNKSMTRARVREICESVYREVLECTGGGNPVPSTPSPAPTTPNYYDTKGHSSSTASDVDRPTGTGNAEQPPTGDYNWTGDSSRFD